MPKGSPELTAERREEIISACEKLYQTMSFKDITIIEIGKATSFTRTSIYNYFNTKEEIFLAMLQKEYERWIEELEKIISDNETLTKNQFADKIAKSLENRRQLLKLMSMNHFDMEENSRDENLAEFKKSYGKSLRTVKKCLDKFFPKKSEVEKENFWYEFFPFVYGIYPYAVVTEKQNRAMEKAGVNFKFHSIYELAYNCILKLLD
ncbi:MAG: TetR family transcriptional regulator [Selenomonadaceae bacterium]|nr:TetR family transcriptional regulator [Selenomonadaceae bacterium]